MGQNSKIQWTHHTFNPWRGCTKVAAGCKNCYADAQAKRNPGTLGIWGDHGTRVVGSPSYWKNPSKWNKIPILQCVECGFEIEGEESPDGSHEGRTWLFECPSCDGTNYRLVRPRVFCASMADVFEDWNGTMLRHDGCTLWICPGCGMWRDGALPEVQRNGPHCNKCNLTSHPLRMSDVRRRLFELIDATPNLDWLLVTKRPENILRYWKVCYADTNGDGDCSRNCLRFGHRFLANVWLLTSIA